MTVWDYRVVECVNDEQDVLCAYGEEGWELVAVVPESGNAAFRTSDGKSVKATRFYLKRPATHG